MEAGTTTKKATPPTDGGVGEPWYYLFWSPIRWGVFLTYEILKEVVTRDGNRRRQFVKERQANRKKS